ncbi:MAG: PAS domain S-box protein [Verrucomicrobia bacterium]|nr:PAS domain S-box protein [Verrucomicrobiota bacterium]
MPDSKNPAPSKPPVISLLPKWQVFAALLAITILCEWITSQLLPKVVYLSGFWEVLLHGSLFALVLFPLMHKFAFAPLLSQIEAREKYERQRIDAEEQHRIILQSAQDGFWIADGLTGRLLEVNDAYCRMSGYTEAELLQKHMWELDSDKPSKPKGNEPLIQVNASGYARFERRQLRKNGESFPVQISAQYSNLRGGVFLLFLQDISERLAAEEALRVNESRFRNLTDNVGSAIVTADEGGKIVSWNRMAETIFGRPAAEAIGMPLVTIVPERFREAHRAGMERFRRTGESHVLGKTIELPGLHRDGSEFPMDITLSMWSDGQQRLFTGLMHDITERKKAEQTLRESEDRLRDLFERMNDLVQIVSPEGKLLFVNRAWREALGYTEAEVQNVNVFQLISPDCREHCGAIFQRLMRGEDVGMVEVQFVSKTGQKLDLTGHVNVRFENGVPVSTRGIFRDETKRKQAELALHELNASLERRVEERAVAILSLEAKLEQLLNTAPVVIYSLEAEGSMAVKYVSENARRILGFDPQEFPKAAVFWGNRLHPEDQERVFKSRQRLLQTGHEELDYRIEAADGRYRWYRDQMTLGRHASGALHEIVGCLVDITERKEAETALKASEARLLDAQRIAKFGNWEHDHRTNQLYWSDEVYRIFGVERAAFNGTPEGFFTLVHPEDVSKANQAYQNAIAAGLPSYHYTHRICLSGSEVKHVEEQCQITYSPSGTPLLSRGTVQDITDRIQSDHALRTSQQRYESVIRHISDALMVENVEGEVVFANHRFLELFDTPATQLREFRLADHVDEQTASRLADYRDRLKHNVESAARLEFECRLSKTRRMWLQLSIAAVLEEKTVTGIQYLMRDVSKEREAQRQLQHSQRLESIGTLAGGIAHDLNNALAPILMGMEFLRHQAGGDSSIMDTMESSTRRAADMVRQLLTFAKGAEGARVSVNLKHLIKEMQGIIKGTFPKNIDISVHYKHDLTPVLGDATQLHQVLLNLCVNARDAMPHGGKLSIEAEEVEVDALYAASVPGGKSGQYVRVRIRDTGTGIPADIIDKIFDPFFTTKAPDKGTGLGLSTVMGIIKGHGGFIQVYSQPNSGACFTIYLPPERTGKTVAEPPTKENTVTFAGNGEKVLLVDDEAAIRSVGAALLEGLNFTPMLACDGAEGLMELACHKAELHAVLTDLHMPNMDGMGFIRAVRRVLPNIPIIAMSGRFDGASLHELKNLKVNATINKPFTAFELASAMQKIHQ